MNDNDQSQTPTRVLIAVTKALHEAGVRHPFSRAKAFEYDRDGATETGVEVTLLFPQYAAQGIEAASADETVQLGSVHESPVRDSECAQDTPPPVRNDTL